MKFTPLLRNILFFLASCAFIFFRAPTAVAEEFEAVSGRISSDYKREKLADGTFKSEYYAFGRGGFWSGPISDKTIDKMDFMTIAHVMAGPLASQHYIPAKDPNKTNLLIMVYWGTTYAPEKASESSSYQLALQAQEDLSRVQTSARDAHNQSEARTGNILVAEADDELSTAIAAVQAENRMRDLTDRNNASMLGYDSWWSSTFDAPNGTPLEVRKRDMLNELEEDRYFVVLMAYDFQLLLKQKKHKLVWETRFSMREHVNAFDEKLPAMVLGASKYFGKDSNGLIHDSIPEGRVDVGEITDLGTVSEK